MVDVPAATPAHAADAATSKAPEAATTATAADKMLPDPAPSAATTEQGGAPPAAIAVHGADQLARAVDALLGNALLLRASRAAAEARARELESGLLDRLLCRLEGPLRFPPKAVHQDRGKDDAGWPPATAPRAKA